MLALFACFLTVLLLFVGLGVDLGFAYITQARLAKAVDAAALAGISNFYQGAATATTVANNTFTVNFSPNNKQLGYIQGTPTVQTSFSVDPNSNELFTVSATATMNTFFIGVIGWPTLNISDSSTATRAPVAVTLVLDRSGSMVDDGGSTYLPPAVINFITVFQDNVDQAAVLTFATTVTNDVPMTTPFIAKVTTAVNNITANGVWGGGTFSDGGMTNALAIENSVTVPANQNLIKAVVFFTDGLANMIQNTLICPATNAWVIGGYDSGTAVDFSPTNLLITADAQENPQNYGGCYYDNSCAQSAPSCCGASQFLSIDGTMKNFCRVNVTEDATNRVIQVANQMRADGIYVYSIGLSDGTLPIDFLQNVANDPNGPQYDPTKLVGQAVITGNGSDLNQLFQQIAGDIQLRLVH
ncbi:MAG: VWA domain-containing protein [Verrucomicrobiia bacterium]|jgi:Flp pilus assembly protein TadG